MYNIDHVHGSILKGEPQLIEDMTSEQPRYHVTKRS